MSATESGPKFTRGERFKYWLVAQIAARLLRTLFRTCRVKVMRQDLVEKYFKAGRSGIGVTWHCGAIYSLYYFGYLNPAVMISRSRDGEYLARYLEIMGGIPVRGSCFCKGETGWQGLFFIILNTVPRKIELDSKIPALTKKPAIGYKILTFN